MAEITPTQAEGLQYFAAFHVADRHAEATLKAFEEFVQTDWDANRHEDEWTRLRDVIANHLNGIDLSHG